jgi:general secretion pathway protein C
MLRSQVVFRSIPLPSVRAVPALVTAMLWCALAAGVAYWVLHFPRETAVVLPAVSTPTVAPATDTSHMARALGQVQAQAVVSADTNRFQLLGVISSSSGRGSALIAIDGQPPKAWRVGQALQEGVYLQKLTPRQAWLGQTPTGPAQWALRMAGPDSNTP